MLKGEREVFSSVLSDYALLKGKFNINSFNTKLFLKKGFSTV